MENLKVKDLKALAKERGIKGYYKLRKAELIKLIEELDLIEFESIKTYSKKCSHKIREKSCKHCGICIHDRVLYMCKECKECGGGKGICEHDKQKRYCKECNDKLTTVSNLPQPDIVYDLININSPPHASAAEQPIKKTTLKRCPHGKQKNYCKECEGSQICHHKRFKRYCKECVGSQICSHNRVKYTCKECAGKGIRQHGINKRQCKECGGKGICQHGRQKYHCKECGGKGICQHGKNKYLCKDCGGKGICPHGKQKSQCKECNATQ